MAEETATEKTPQEELKEVRKAVIKNAYAQTYREYLQARYDIYIADRMVPTLTEEEPDQMKKKEYEALKQNAEVDIKEKYTPALDHFEKVFNEL